jgi:hypothetical protein
MKQLWHPRTRLSSPTALVLEPAAPALHRPANLTLGVPAVTAPASLTKWAREALDFHPFPAQSEILDCTAAHVILCCSRQFGKSTLTAIKMAHHALANPEAAVVVGSPSERQSGLLVDRAAAFLHHAGVRTRGYSRTTHGVRLPNGSAICALPMSERTTRGFSAVSLLIFEEAAFVPDSFYHMATPYQAAVRNPSLWLLSTPGSRSGFFFEEWIDAGRTHWRRFQVRASECPHFRPEFLAQERIRKGDSIYRREYECEFVSDATQIITRELWDSALDDDDIPFNGGKPLWND